MPRGPLTKDSMHTPFVLAVASDTDKRPRTYTARVSFKVMAWMSRTAFRYRVLVDNAHLRHQNAKNLLKTVSCLVVDRESWRRRETPPSESFLLCEAHLIICPGIGEYANRW